MSSESILQVERLSKAFGGVRAVNEMELTVREGGVTALVGPNGAGKTTLFNLISGVARPTSGRVRFQGRDVTGAGPERLAVLGLSRTFQHVSVFESLSPVENVLVGLDQFSRRRWFGRRVRAGTSAAAREARARDLLDFVGLGELAVEQTSALSYGQKKLLDLATTLATEPDLLLLDEPAAGLNSTEKMVLAGVIARVNDAGVSVCVVEHDMQFIRSIADYMFVMNFGALLAEGLPEEVLQVQAVAEAYLGPGHGA